MSTPIFEQYVLQCDRCPLQVPITMAFSGIKLQDAVRRAEREWYIKELES
jgi:hypothetical protein